MDSLQNIKQRFGIIGNNPLLNRAIEKTLLVAPTDISVLVVGESGVGKEFLPKIIHHYSHRKHKQYIAVNCGAIPEGTIDSELFGHEKGAFTGATQTRKGYFEVADGGTIFLDEVGDLPLSTQVRLLRILETGEFMKVGSSEVQNTDVRIVAATNIKLMDAINRGKFREDLYYRLNTVQIDIPPLRDRKDDISLLFRKFASDFAHKYRMPTVELSNEAMHYISLYHWSGNIRQLRNFTEQISVVEKERHISLEKVKSYLSEGNTLPMLSKSSEGNSPMPDTLERELLFKFLLDMKKDLNDLRTLNLDLLKNQNEEGLSLNTQKLIQRIIQEQRIDSSFEKPFDVYHHRKEAQNDEEQSYNLDEYEYEDIKPVVEAESLSLQDKEKDMIFKALEKYQGKRKSAAKELGISERTLYRKIKQYDL